jgi:type IV pilus assembly protein PilE
MCRSCRMARSIASSLDTENLTQKNSMNIQIVKRKVQRGFTLIELMIVVAVIGILASVAYPSYVEQIRKGNRTEGKAALMRTSQTLERFFTARGRYPSVVEYATLFGLASGANLFSNPDTPTIGKYEITYVITVPNVQNDGGLEYTLAARLVAGAGADPQCGNYSLNSRAVRNVSVGGNKEICWR